MITPRLSAAFVAVVALAGMATTEAKASYDGLWSISIVTKSGSCEPGPGLSVLINNGKVASSNASIGVSGRVHGTGGISVTIKSSAGNAVGSGRLVESSGFGTWRGGPCAGTWTAQRI
jgi:hypothetical protein